MQKGHGQLVKKLHWRTKIVFDINVVAELDQLLDGFHMATVGRAMEWRELICVSHIHLNRSPPRSDGLLIGINQNTPAICS